MKIQKQFLERLKLYIEDENHQLLNIHSLHGQYKGLWSFNASSDIRVIFDTSEESVTLLVAIGTHSELYG
jgi:mRNA-degrading endonuclease YafQ of YafQ-DinJ toxin-antitoxin module